MESLSPSQYSEQLLPLFSALPDPCRVQVDSRLVRRGDLFWTLPGDRSDGEAFILEAVKRGAAALVVSEAYSGADHGLPVFRVAHRLLALQALAHWRARLRKGWVVAVTGSVGKTTTKSFLYTLLSQRYRVFQTPGNANSQIGLPLALLNGDLDTEVLVLEMGMSRPGEISRLVDIVRPDYAVLTAVELAHAAFFEGWEDIARAKAEIFSSPTTRQGFLGLELPASIAVACPIRRFDHVLLPDLCWPFEARHLRHNLHAAIVVARELGLSWEEIQAGMDQVQVPERRGQTQVVRGVTFINDSYNACAASMKAALKSLPDGVRKVAVLGGMKELGRFCESCHLEVGSTALETVDTVFCLGQECRPILDLWASVGREAYAFESRNALVQALAPYLKAGDVVLLKGACSWALWNVIEEWEALTGDLVAR